MCGICGIVDFERGIVPPQTIQRMADTIAHRGPDDAGYHFEEGVGLGHRRLSIIDVQGGHQPLCNEDESIWIVFNGEIYNHVDLRAFLESKGHRFRTNSDTEVIVHLYEEVGQACFEQLRGMFAIALWDRPRRRVVLARDRIGKKPLFYSHTGSRLTFGSELKSVRAGCNSSFELDATALSDYFTFLYIPTPKSIYKEVRKVAPAHYMIFSDQGASEQSYWDLSFDQTEDRSEEVWKERIRESLTEAVQVRLMSEVPLGSFLSGGVDSSAVVASMAQLSDSPVNTCSVGFDEAQYSETQYARTVAQHVGARYHERLIRQSAVDVVERLVWHYDEPFADSSAVPTYYVSEAARKQVTVALSGDGGDESFAGYKRYAYDAEDNRLRSGIPLGIRANVLGPLAELYPALEGAPKILRRKSFLRRLGQDPVEGYLERITVPKAVRVGLFSEELKNDLAGYDPLEQFREHYKRADTDDLLSRIQYLDIKTYLTDDICVKVDRASMAASLEVRCPLLDHHFIELAARIPSRLKLRNKEGKYIFKRAVEKMFPPGFLNRPKQGFAVPVAEWFRGELREAAEEVLFEPDGLLNPSYLRFLWNRHQRKIQDHSAVLWGVFMFRKWQSTFLWKGLTRQGQASFTTL